MVRRPPIQTAFQNTERVIELIPRYGLGALAVAQLPCLLVRKREGIFDPSETPVVSKRHIAPLTTCVGERDQMCCEIAAIDGGDVSRIERTQILGVIPIEEVTSKAGEL